jgi:hypothetical protein
MRTASARPIIFQPIEKANSSSRRRLLLRFQMESPRLSLPGMLMADTVFLPWISRPLVHYSRFQNMIKARGRENSEMQTS